MASPLDKPFDHSVDNDAFHFPGGYEFNVYDYTLNLTGGTFGLTKFMALELVAVVILLLLCPMLAWGIRRRGYAKGPIANAFEGLCNFIRTEVAIPAIGEHDAHRFLPFLWSVFFFILTCNMLGMLPWMGSPTGSISVTAGLALCAAVVIHGSGLMAFGPGGYVASLVPHVPAMLYPLMFVIEVVGHMIKPIILAVRLFINMLAGHTVLFVIMSFIAMIGPQPLYFVVAPASLFGVTMLSLLELLVAFLQAFVFTFLTAIFIGAAVHPHH